MRIPVRIIRVPITGIESVRVLVWEDELSGLLDYWITRLLVYSFTRLLVGLPSQGPRYIIWSRGENSLWSPAAL